jgi:hypothetical protein
MFRTIILTSLAVAGVSCGGTQAQTPVPDWVGHWEATEAVTGDKIEMTLDGTGTNVHGVGVRHTASADQSFSVSGLLPLQIAILYNLNLVYGNHQDNYIASQPDSSQISASGFGTSQPDLEFTRVAQ